MASSRQTSKLDAFAALTAKGFDLKFLSHAGAIAAGDFPGALAEIAQVLDEVALPITEIIGSGGGGGETKFTQRLRRALAGRGWAKHHFIIEKRVNGQPRGSTSHEVDHVKRFDAGVIACEIEWNNKDPFFDRDLENFKRLHAEGAISLGVLITRGASLQDALWDAVMRFAHQRGIQNMDDLAAQGVAPTPRQRENILRRVHRKDEPVPFASAWADNFVSNKFGQATTHWRKLMARVERGVGNPCPLLLVGLPASILLFDDAKVDAVADEDLAEGLQAGVRFPAGIAACQGPSQVGCPSASGWHRWARKACTAHRPGCPRLPSPAARRGQTFPDAAPGCKP